MEENWEGEGEGEELYSFNFSKPRKNPSMTDEDQIDQWECPSLTSLKCEEKSTDNPMKFIDRTETSGYRWWFDRDLWRPPCHWIWFFSRHITFVKTFSSTSSMDGSSPPARRRCLVNDRKFRSFHRLKWRSFSREADRKKSILRIRMISCSNKSSIVDNDGKSKRNWVILTVIKVNFSNYWPPQVFFFFVFVFFTETIITFLSIEFNYLYVQKSGFSHPVIIKDRRGLGLRVPTDRFTIDEVRQCVGSDRMIDVINVNTQESFSMSMKAWAEYYNQPAEKRQRILNVISLECSHTKLENYVESPSIVGRRRKCHRTDETLEL